MGIKCLNLSKLFFAVYLLYTYVFRQALSLPRMISYLLLPAAVICFLLYRPELKMDFFSGSLILYLVYSVIISLILSKDTVTMLKACKDLALYTVVFCLTFEYSIEDKSIDFAGKVLILWALSYAAMILFFGVSFGSGGQKASIAEDFNSNSISRIMVFAIGYKLYRFTKEKRSLPQSVLSIVEIVLFLYIVTVTVSKMAIICSLLLIVLWLLFCSVRADRSSILKKTVILLAVAAAAGLLFSFFKSHFSNQYAYLLLRMSGLTGGGSSIRRLSLIREGLAVFSEHPLFGVGLAQFSFYSVFSAYSHCSYTEILSCTGTVGALLFFSPMVLLFINLIGIAKTSDGIQRKQALSVLFMYMMLVIVMIVQIIIYSQYLMFLLAMIDAAVYTDLEFSDADLPLHRAYELPFEGEIHAKKENTD